MNDALGNYCSLPIFVCVYVYRERESICALDTHIVVCLCNLKQVKLIGLVSLKYAIWRTYKNGMGKKEAGEH